MDIATAPAPAPTVAIVPQMLDRQIGFSIYLDGKSVGCCANAQQIAGWWAALDAEATCALCDTMSANGKTAEEMDNVLDGMTFEQWRYGI